MTSTERGKRMTEKDAIALAEAYLDVLIRPVYRHKHRTELAIVESLTVRKDWGWVFSWNTREFAETLDARHGILGNGPIAVIKFDSSVHFLAPARGLEKGIQYFEKTVVRYLKNRKW